LQQVFREGVPLLQINRAVVREPDLPIIILPDQCFEWQVDATLGDAIINGVPDFGLPKMSSFVGCIFRPALAASPLWSIRAWMVNPFV
jgi:hypothetical protein